MALPVLTLDISYEGQHVRVVGTKDRPEWVAADVCAVLGIQNPAQAIQDFKPSQKGICLIYTLGGPQETLTVTRSGLYKLITRSRKPSAERFQDWVFDEVLPSIHEYGCYPPPDALSLAGEGRAIVTLDGETVRNILHEVTGPHFERIETQVSALAMASGQSFSRIEKHLERVPATRREISDADKRIHCYIITKWFKGLCPCCDRVQIVNDETPIDGLRFDHWTSRTNAQLSQTWGICDDCNIKLGEPGSPERQEFLYRFKVYQDRRQMMVDDGSVRYKRKDDPGQLPLFSA